MGVIVLSAHADEECLRQALACGASGYLTMTVSAVELELAIKAVANGETHISQSATKLMVDFVRSSAKGPSEYLPHRWAGTLRDQSRAGTIGGLAHFGPR